MTSQSAVSGPRLSICIPTYDRPRLLERALMAVLSDARWRPEAVEILISDNSPDVTEAIALPLLDRFEGISRYLGNRPNLGMIGNFNQCIAEATGDALLILHDDDYLLPGAVEAILAGLRRAPLDQPVLLFGVNIVNEDGRLLRRQIPADERHLSPRSAMVQLLANSSFVRFPGVVVRRNAYETVGGFREDLLGADDFDMWIRLFSQFGVRLLPTLISAYSIHEEAATTAMFNRETVNVLLELFHRAEATGVLSQKMVRRCQAAWFHQFILSGVYRSLRAGDEESARHVLALLHDPAIKRLGSPRRWVPLRVAFRLLLRLPPGLAKRAVRLTGTLDLQHRLGFVT
jgi:glycosyltransferase involved in cell wall biosynthesis